MRRQTLECRMVELKKIGMEDVKQPERLMKIWFEKGKARRLEVYDVTLQGIIVGKTVNEVWRMEDEVRIGVTDRLFTVTHLDFAGIDQQGKKIE